MIESDGILLGSPVYFTDVTAGMKALIDRCGLVSTANGGLFQRKVGAAVVAVRRAGAVRTFDTLNHLKPPVFVQPDDYSRIHLLECGNRAGSWGG